MYSYMYTAICIVICIATYIAICIAVDIAIHIAIAIAIHSYLDQRTCMRPATHSHPHRRNSRTTNPEPAWTSGKLDESGNCGHGGSNATILYHWAWTLSCVCHAAAPVPRLPEWQSAVHIDRIVFSGTPVPARSADPTEQLANPPHTTRATCTHLSS